MDQTALVATDLTIGSEIVQALDRSGLEILVAMWLYADEHGDWRFVLASNHLDAAEPAEAYGLVHDALSAGGISLERTPTLAIFGVSDPFIRAIRKIFGKARNVEGMRLGGQFIGDRFVPDAFVYRIR